MRAPTSVSQCVKALSGEGPGAVELVAMVAVPVEDVVVDELVEMKLGPPVDVEAVAAAPVELDGVM